MKLYEITDVLREILMVLAEPEPDPQAADYDLQMAERQTALAALDRYEGDLKDKLRAYIALAQELRCEREARDAEIERIERNVLDRMRRANEHSARKEEWLMRSAQAVIEQFNVPLPLKYLEFTVSRRKNPACCKVLDPAALPAEYLRVVPETREPDKRKLLADLREGCIIPGAALSDAGYSLTVR